MTNDVNLMTSDAAMQAPMKRRKKIASLERRKARAGWIFVLPFILGFLLIYLPMILESILLTFKWESQMAGVKFVEWVGFQNYIDVFDLSSAFSETLVKGLKELFLDVPCILIFSLFMAVMLNQKMMGRAAFRAIFFLPVVLSTGIMVSGPFGYPVDADFDNGLEGAGSAEETAGLISATDLEMIFGGMTVGADVVTFIVNLLNDIYGIVNRSGVQLLIFLAALQGISPAIYESCKIDGATSWETFWKITLPMISPMILVNGVYTIIDAFTMTTNPVMSFIRNEVPSMSSIYPHRESVQTTMSWIYFLIVILIVALIAAIFSAFVFYQRKSE